MNNATIGYEFTKGNLYLKSKIKCNNVTGRRTYSKQDIKNLVLETLKNDGADFIYVEDKSDDIEFDKTDDSIVFREFDMSRFNEKTVVLVEPDDEMWYKFRNCYLLEFTYSGDYNLFYHYLEDDDFISRDKRLVESVLGTLKDAVFVTKNKECCKGFEKFGEIVEV